MALTRKKIASLTYVKGYEEFLNETDGMVHLLKDFLMAFPYANFKSGVWNEYEKMDMAKAIQRVNNSPYGADIEIAYDEDWENGDCNGTCEVYLSCPSNGDMW